MLEFWGEKKHGTVGSGSQFRIEVELYSNQVWTSRRHKYCGFNSRLEIVNKYIVDDSNKEVLKCTNTHCVKISYNLNPGGAMLLARLVQTSPSPFWKGEKVFSFWFTLKRGQCFRIFVNLIHLFGHPSILCSSIKNMAFSLRRCPFKETSQNREGQLVNFRCNLKKNNKNAVLLKGNIRPLCCFKGK